MSGGPKESYFWKPAMKLSRSKHSGVLSVFRQHFVKTGLVSSELGEIYGQVTDDRHESDYELISAISIEDVEADLQEAKRFVEELDNWLKKEGWL